MNIQLIAADDHKFQAWVSGPEDAQYGVVVLPEIFGVNSNIREMAENFVNQGYRIISPSLFDRKAESGLELGYDQQSLQQGLAIRKAISDDQALLDIQAAAKYLSKQKNIFITGYCWGGYLSWRAACLLREFTAASCWHGGGIAKNCAEKPLMPVQMHFGSKDKSIPLSDVETIRQAQPAVEIHVYTGADHAFGRTGTSTYHQESAELAWRRTFEFFAKNHVQHMAAK